MGPLCPLCGKKLTPASQRISFVYEHTPLTDWISWNGVLRVILPVLLTVLVIVIATEGIARGGVGIASLFSQGLLQVLSAVAVAMGAAVFLIFSLQGKEYIQFILDNQGIHAYTFIKNPTKIKCLLRMQTARHMEGEFQEYAWVGEKHILWADIKRIQLWADREKILLYNPKWWMALAIHCLPGTYDDAQLFIYNKVKKRSGIKMAQPAVMEYAEGYQPEMPQDLSMDDMEDRAGAPAVDGGEGEKPDFPGE